MNDRYPFIAMPARFSAFWFAATGPIHLISGRAAVDGAALERPEPAACYAKA